MNNLCIIPARGGSKRIPRKNIRLFLGKPIIAYSIEKAISSGLFKQIFVSTDDYEIAEIAKQYGASVPIMRSEKNSDDFATTVDVLEEVFHYYENEGFIFENACCLYPCSPLIKEGHLVETYNKMIQNKFDSVFPIVKYSTSIQRALKLEQDKVQMFNPQNINSRTQDFEPAFYDSGQFYWFNIKKVLETKKILMDNTGGIILDEYEAQDIDNENDWQLAEFKFKLINS